LLLGLQVVERWLKQPAQSVNNRFDKTSIESLLHDRHDLVRVVRHPGFDVRLDLLS